MTKKFLITVCCYYCYCSLLLRCYYFSVITTTYLENYTKFNNLTTSKFPGETGSDHATSNHDFGPRPCAATATTVDVDEWWMIPRGGNRRSALVMKTRGIIYPYSWRGGGMLQLSPFQTYRPSQLRAAEEARSPARQLSRVGISPAL